MWRVTRSALVAELDLLYRAAGRPSYRSISNRIRERNHDMPDTVSHETVGAILRGEAIRWTKVECVVRQLASMAVHHPDVRDEIQRFHAYWSAERDATAAGAAERHVPAPRSGESRPAGPERSAPLPATSPDGPVPDANPVFTGRAAQLDRIGRLLDAAPWRPLILHGLGGVGKSQLAIEYLHRHAARYDMVWWVSAEDPSVASAALAALAERQDWNTSLNMAQTVRTVLTQLESGSGARWLLVFDNAGAPDEIGPLLPAAGGHVLVTTRDDTWPSVGRAIEVDVFSRPESIEFLQRRGRGISFDDADQLADRLGDLPLVLEQVAAMQSATGTAVQEYLRQLDERGITQVASSPTGDHPASVVTPFVVATERIRAESVAAAQLLGLLACLGAEPISLTLLRSAGGRIPPPLGRVLDQPDPLDDVIRRLRHYGLVRYREDGPRLQVHRLVQAIVRETLTRAEIEQAYENAQGLLVAANPGRPDRPLTWDLHAQIGPHLRPARAIHSSDPAVRAVVLDQIRYLFQIGNYDGSLRLSAEALAAWHDADGDRVDEQVFACRRFQATVLQALGRYEKSRQLTFADWERLHAHPDFGPDAATTMLTANNLASLYRLFGRYADALEVQAGAYEQSLRINGPEHGDTRVAQSNLAVSHRMVGAFQAAYAIDAALVEARRMHLGDDHYLTLFSRANLARDLYGLGRYREALDLQQASLPVFEERLGGRHQHVLIARRTVVIALRKVGQTAEAVAEGRRLYHACQGRLGSDHEYNLAAMMTYANALLAAGQVSSAWSLATEAVDRYRRQLGERNPLTLAAAVNQAVILRAMGERIRARNLGEATYRTLRQEVGADHPFTLVSAVGVANDLALAHETESARNLYRRTLEDAARAIGREHPDTLVCAINLAGLAPEDDPVVSARRTSDLDRLRVVLGPQNPQVVALVAGELGECDIEPPPA